jgi:hypothetical protein
MQSQFLFRLNLRFFCCFASQLNLNFAYGRACSPSFFSSLTPPPVTPARRCDFAAIGDGEEWNLGDDRDDSLDDGEMGLESPDDDSVMPWSKGKRCQ